MNLKNRIKAWLKQRNRPSANKAELAAFKAIRSARDRLFAAKTGQATTKAAVRRLEESRNRLTRKAGELRAKAYEALEGGREDQALRYLNEKTLCLNQAARLEEKIKSARETSLEIAQMVTDLERNVETAEIEAHTLVARGRAAEAGKAVAELLSGLGGDDFLPLESLAASILEKEAEAQGYNDVFLGSSEEVNRKHTIEELESMKRELGRR